VWAAQGGDAVAGRQLGARRVSLSRRPRSLTLSFSLSLSRARAAKPRTITCAATDEGERNWL